MNEDAHKSEIARDLNASCNDLFESKAGSLNSTEWNTSDAFWLGPISGEVRPYFLMVTGLLRKSIHLICWHLF